MKPKRTFRIKSAEDIVTAAALGLGFLPTESMVMVAFTPGGPFYARVDLPHVVQRRKGLSDEKLPQLMLDAFRALLPAAADNHAEQLFMVYFADLADELYIEQLDLSLRYTCRDGDLPVECSILTDSYRYIDLDSEDRSLVEFDLRTHPEVTQAVYEGRPLLGSRAELESCLDPAPDLVRRRIGKLAARLARELGCGRPGTPVEYFSPGEGVLRFGCEMDAMVTAVLRHERLLTDDEAAGVLTACWIPPVRDLLMSRVDRQNAERYVEVLRDLVRRSPKRLLSEVAAMLGFCAWVSGQGALAWVALDHCWQLDPDNGIAKYVGDLLEAAVSPRNYDPTMLDSVRDLFYAA
ncbi:MAG: DUF4192 domain-containing protein [Nocardioidaceae bacterium]